MDVFCSRLRYTFKYELYSNNIRASIYMIFSSPWWNRNRIRKIFGIHRRTLYDLFGGVMCIVGMSENNNNKSFMICISVVFGEISRPYGQTRTNWRAQRWYPMVYAIWRTSTRNRWCFLYVYILLYITCSGSSSSWLAEGIMREKSQMSSKWKYSRIEINKRKNGFTLYQL